MQSSEKKQRQPSASQQLGGTQARSSQNSQSPQKAMNQGNGNSGMGFSPAQVPNKQEYTPEQQQNPNTELDLNVYEDDDDETLHRKLIAAKIARKRAEEDLKLLSNRVALLKQEEQKAWKKIDETKKRAKDIMSQKQRNQEHMEEKIQRQRQKEQEEQMKQAFNKQYKDQMKMNLEITKKEKDDKVKKEVDYVKMEKREQKELQLKIKEQEYVKNTSTKEMIKQQQMQARDKKQQELIQRQMRTKNQIEEKAMEEQKQKLEHDNMIARMEQEELELIKKLQNTQMLQKEAYQDLESALSGEKQNTEVNDPRPGTASSKKSGGRIGQSKQSTRKSQM